MKKAKAATGVRLHLTNKENILPGMLFQEINDNLDQIKETFKKELSKAVNLDKEGIIIKADSLGSLEALITLLKQENITIVKAGIGPISKQDLISAKANLDIDPLNAVILGFNVSLEEELENPNIKIIKNEVIFKLIDDLKVWRKNKQEEIERERLLSLVPISKVEILKQYVFKNSNPAVFGVKIISGKLKSGAHIIDDSGEEIAKLKSIQHEKESRNEALEGQEVAIALPGLYFDRHLKDKKFLYTDLSEQNFKKLKKNKDLLSSSELKTLQEIADIKQRKNPNWGM